MGRLTAQSLEEWIPLRDPRAIAELDLTPEQLAEAYGWSWEEVSEDGLGRMAYLPLAWDGQSRFLLSATLEHPQSGVGVEAPASENTAIARADLLDGLGLQSETFLAIAEGDTWFARWDPPHTAGERPATAKRSCG